MTAFAAPTTWRAVFHVLLDFWIGTAAFVFAITMVSATFGLAFTAVLWPIPLTLLLFGLRLIGAIERARVAALLDELIADPYPVFTGRLWRQAWARVSCGAPWLELVYCVVLFPLGLVGFVVVVTTWSGGLALATLPLYIGQLPGQAAAVGAYEIRSGTSLAAASAAGVALFLLAPWVTRGWAAVDRRVAAALLGPRRTEEVEVLEERVETLEATRAWALEIAEAERRRIERDLHDGAQQRLVALAMEIGRARERLDTDPEGARALLDHAHEESKRAVAELRDLARGIHPVSLSDRGLAGAIPALAGRCPFPVNVQVSVATRLAPAIEGIAYFVVSEGLANVAKHASARAASVRVQRVGDTLTIDMSDDGVGGADPALGTGLRGLADRVHTVDGTFAVTSPVGGPTQLHVELPCAS